MSDYRRKAALRLRAARQAKGWTMEETAKHLNVAVSRLGNWESEIRNPKLEQIEQYAQFFGKPFAYMAGLSDDDGSIPSVRGYAEPRLSAGIPDDQASRDTAFGVDFLRRKNLQPAHLALIRMPDRYMAPHVHEGDEVVIDGRVSAVIDVGIYAFLVNGRVWIRWARPEIDGSLNLFAEDADKFPSQLIAKDKLDTIRVIGRAIRVHHEL